METKVENSRYCDALLFFSAIVLVTPVSFSFTSLNPAIPVFETLFNNTYYQRYGEHIPESTTTLLMSFMLSFPVLSALVGATTTQKVLGLLGPKRTQIVLHLYSILTNVGIIAMIGGLTHSYEVIIIGRMLMGPCLSVSLNVGSVLVAEMCAKDRQPFYQSILGIGMAFGALIGPILGYDKVLGSMQLWPVLISMTSFLALIWLLLAPFIVDSPYYLLKVGRKEDAMLALRKLRNGDEKQISEELAAIEEEMSRNKPGENPNDKASVRTVSLVEMFKTRHYRRIATAVFVTYANMMLVGVNNIAFFSSQIFLNAGIPPDAVAPATIGVFSGQFIVALFGSKLIDRFGARKVSIGGSVVMSAGHILVTASLATLDRIPEMRYISIAGMVIFMLGWSGGANLSTFPIVNGVTTIETRETCITYGSVILWLTSFIVAFLPPYLESFLGPYILIPWLTFTIVFMLYMIFILPDMHNKTETEIQKILSR